MAQKALTKRANLTPALVEERIDQVRGQRVMLDIDLAELYQVETFNLNKAVKRNLSRFPRDFMFQLSKAERDGLTFQNGMSKEGRGGRRTLPFAFTEQGVAMLSSVLNSTRAVQVNIVIIRTFVQLRELLGARADLTHRLDLLERKYDHHDDELRQVFEAIRRLVTPAVTSKKRIGFRAEVSG